MENGDSVERPVIHLIGGPSVTCDGRLYTVPEGSKRLLAFAALRGRRIERSYAAGTLWPTGDDVRAAGNLRSALWRLRRAGVEVIEADKWSLRLVEGVHVDVHDVTAWADRMITGNGTAADLTTCHVPDSACSLLPGWYDDWVIMERERLRQRVLHGLEALSERLSASGRYAEAVDAAVRVVSEDPLRESAQRALITVYLAQDDAAQARLALMNFGQLVRRQLGVEPSRQLCALVGLEHAHPPVSGSRSA